MSYDMIDRYLRNNLHDDDYAEYSAALDAVAEDAARVARLYEARRWANSVDELKLLLRATDARYMELVQQVADGRAMQLAPPILVNLGPNVKLSGCEAVRSNGC